MNSIAAACLCERTSLTLFAPAPSTISFVPLMRNLSPAAPFPTPSKALGTRNRLLRYGICVPCKKQPPRVRDAFSKALGAQKQAPTVRKRYSVPKTPSSGTRRVFRGTRYQKQASTVQNMRAVRKTGSYGTRRIFRSSPCSKQASMVRERYSVPEKPSYGTERNDRIRLLRSGFWLEDAAITNNPTHPSPIKLTKLTKTTLPPQKHPKPIKATLLHKNHPTPSNSLNPQKPPCPIKAKRPTDSRRPTLRLCTKT